MDEHEERHRVHLKVKAYVIDTRYEALLASDITERARRAYREEGLLPMTAEGIGPHPASPSSSLDR
jgi:hypothetical protein